MQFVWSEGKKIGPGGDGFYGERPVIIPACID
jgi:hypothetical protein